ncbi:hypothetical protein GQ44DRAFT_711433 [Phaeosphaeriaceae sp. PMI808]|nr:hypothetical protein GQ44DRAFT_711433 [Phaeosphaeriaceae sp. PMI808]
MHYGTGAYYGINGQKIMEGRDPFPDPNPGLAPTRYDVLKVCDLYSESCFAICGDGILSPGEKCDDGNNIDNDGCAANCQSYTNTLCGNGVLDKGEQCDLGNSNGDPGQQCGLDCKYKPVSGTPTPGSCGIQTCNPISGENKCHITSSCIPIDGSPSKPRHLCACRHGFRGLDVAPGDASAQIRIPADKWPSQKGRVFVKPGVACVQ